MSLKYALPKSSLVASYPTCMPLYSHQQANTIQQVMSQTHDAIVQSYLHTTLKVNGGTFTTNISSVSLFNLHCSFHGSSYKIRSRITGSKGTYHDMYLSQNHAKHRKLHYEANDLWEQGSP